MRVFDFDASGQPDEYPLVAVFRDIANKREVQINRKLTPEDDGSHHSVIYLLDMTHDPIHGDPVEEECIECWGDDAALRLAEMLCDTGVAPEGSHNPYGWCCGIHDVNG
jgi:hypothetical protein